MRVAVAGTIGLLGLVLAAGSTGCVGRRYVEETLYGPERKPRVHTDSMVVPDVSPEATNAVHLANAPLGVQAAFLDGHQGAVTVYQVQTLPSGNGWNFYRISYVEDGVPGVDIFQPGGGPTQAPEYVWVAPRSDDLDYRPTAVQPTTRPATQAVH